LLTSTGRSAGTSGKELFTSDSSFASTGAFTSTSSGRSSDGGRRSTVWFASGAISATVLPPSVGEVGFKSAPPPIPASATPPVLVGEASRPGAWPPDPPIPLSTPGFTTLPPLPPSVDGVDEDEQPPSTTDTVQTTRQIRFMNIFAFSLASPTTMRSLGALLLQTVADQYNGCNLPEDSLRLCYTVDTDTTLFYSLSLVFQNAKPRPPLRPKLPASARRVRLPPIV